MGIPLSLMEIFSIRFNLRHIIVLPLLSGLSKPKALAISVVVAPLYSQPKRCLRIRLSSSVKSCQLNGLVTGESSRTSRTFFNPRSKRVILFSSCFVLYIVTSPLQRLERFMLLSSIYMLLTLFCGRKTREIKSYSM